MISLIIFIYNPNSSQGVRLSDSDILIKSSVNIYSTRASNPRQDHQLLLGEHVKLAFSLKLPEYCIDPAVGQGLGNVKIPLPASSLQSTSRIGSHMYVKFLLRDTVAD